MSSSTTVGEVFSKNFASVSKEDTLSQCLSLLKTGMVPVLVVLDSRGKYQGLLARRWILRSGKLDPSKTKVDKLMRSAPEVTEQDSLSKAASLMIENELRELPVFSKKKLVGVVTDEHIIHGAVMTEWGDEKIEEIMTKEPFVVEEAEPIGSVLNLFKERNISHAPVMRKGKLVGIISTQDIIDHFFQPEKREKVGEKIGSKTEIINAPVKNAITRPPITITPETSLKEAEQKMHDYDDCALLAVVDERIVGIATKKDFLEPIAQIGMETPRLTIQFSGRDVEIDEAQRDFMTKDFEILSSKYEKTLELGTLFVYIKRQRATHEGEQLFQCRLHLKTVKGSFFSTAEGWGVEATFRIALERIERQILRSKQFAHYPEFARNYLELLYPEEF